MEKLLKVIDWFAIILLIIGGLNLGMVGLLNYDPLIDMLYDYLIAAHILFFFIGLAACYALIRIASIVYKFRPPYH